MHQHSLADNSWSVLHLLNLVDRPNVGVNPDLGNLYWNYEVPEESNEACIKALAPRAKYWHCKQLHRVHVPDLGKAYFLKVPLPDGEIDYRFAISAMAEAGYAGYIAVEGCREGDQLYRDAKSAEYCREILRDLGQ
jgi:sugar phosphate isomerase/epimerase